MSDTKHLLKRSGIYYFNYRIPDILKPHYAQKSGFLRESLGTGSLREAQRLRTAKLAEIHALEDKLKHEASKTSRYSRILEQLRADRDSAPDSFTELSPDAVNKEDDKDYVDAYFVASAELDPRPSIQDIVKIRAKEHGLTMRQAHQLYLSDHPSTSTTSVREYNHALNFLPKKLQDTPINKLKRDEIKDLIKGTKLKQNSVAARIRYLKRMVKYATSEDKFDGKNPFEDINVKSLMTSGEAEGMKPLPTQIHQRILDDTKNVTDWRYALPRLLPLTGLRISEMLALKPSDVENGMIHVRDGKTNNAIRQIPITSEIEAVLSQLETNDEQLVPHSSRANVNAVVNRSKEKWGWDQGKYGTHSFRKMFATALQETGCPEADASFLMGHSAPTLSYGLYSVNPDVIDRIKPSVEQVINAPVLTALKNELS